MLTAVPGKSCLIKDITKKDDCVLLKSGRGILRIFLYFDDVVRVSFSPEGKFDERQGEHFLPKATATSSLFTLCENDKEIKITTKSLIILVDREKGFVSFDRDGKKLFSEAADDNYTLEKFDVYKNVGQIKTEEVKTADGVKKRIVAANKEYQESLYHTTLRFNFAENEKLFGLGQAEEGVWNLRGTTQYLHQANKKIAIPFLISSLGYGLLFTSQSPAIFSDTLYGSYFYTNADYYLDYFFIAPNEDDISASFSSSDFSSSNNSSPNNSSSNNSSYTVFAKIIARMRALTGKASLPPDYALGYVQSQERYETQEEILATVAEFKKRGIPLSLIVLDWLSWEDGMWGQKSFDKKRFPDVPGMIKKLHEDDIHFMISIWPTMDEKSENYKEMKEKGALLDGVNICNSFDEAARDLYWKQAKRGLADFGVESWWCDSSEPVTPEWNHMERQLPEKVFSEYLQATGDIMPPQKANAYGLYHARGMYEGQTRDFPERQMLILTRSGYPGSQRYGVTLWSGDTCAKWSVLKNQVVQACQFGLSGIPYWTVDIGGFFVKRGEPWYWNGDYPAATEDPAYRELYVRWFQFGAFLPMFRAHGTDCRREPWAFCDETNVFYDTLVSFIKLRYKLMPYIRMVSKRVTENGESFIRPLFMEFSDSNVFDISSQFMFGPSFMVCPVTEPMIDFENYGKAVAGANEVDKDFTKLGTVTYKCAPEIDVYLPADCDWIDWWSEKLYEGGQWIKAPAPIQQMPLFIRADDLFLDL